ncbi:mating type protein A alpha Y mating type dependent binding region-domain-containing protein [Schizophyllum commune]
MEALVPYLQRISSQAKDIVRIAQARGARPAPPPPPSTISFGSLPLPAVNEIRARLIAARIPRRVVQDAISAYEDACSRWRRDLEQAFDAAAGTVLPQNLHLFGALRTRLYTQQVQKWASQVLEIPLRWKAEMDKQRAHIAASIEDKPARPKFHSEYRPLLELYFKFNAYPTYADRRALAEKTGMLTRQITVWFQNHRRRAKGQGPLPRMPPRAKIPLEEFERERENMARKMLPVLLAPHLKPLAHGSDKRAQAGPLPSKSLKHSGKSQRHPEQKTTPKSTKKNKTPLPGPSTFLGSLAEPITQATLALAPRKKSKKNKKKGSSEVAATPQDVVMKDATAPKVKRRKMKKLPGSSSQGSSMEVDENCAQRPSKSSSSAFDSKAELAYAKATYPAPSKYAWVHTRKPSQISYQPSTSDVHMRDVVKLGKGKPPKQVSSIPTPSTVPKHRVSSRLNAMRPPYAFPARYEAAAVPLTFAVAQTTKFTFATDSASFGLRSYSPRDTDTRKPSITIDYLITRFDSLRLLCAEHHPSQSVALSSFERNQLRRLRVEGLTAREAAYRQNLPNTYSARAATTCVVPTAPLASVVVDLSLALRQRRVTPLVPMQPVVQPDAFAPFVALAEKRAKRRARKEKKLQEEKQARKEEKRARKEEKQAKKDRKERKKAGLPRRSPSTLDASDTSSRASSVVSDLSTSSQKSTKSRKSTATPRASSGRTPSLTSTSSRRSSDMSMPSTPRPDQTLPIVAGSDFVLGGDEDITMTPDLAAQLFGDDENSISNYEPPQPEQFSPDMLTFSSVEDGALGDMTADINTPAFGGLSFDQPVFDDMNWTANLSFDPQDTASFSPADDTSTVDLNWLLGQNLAGDAQTTGWPSLSYTPPSTTSKINVLGETYSCELGGPDNMSAPLNLDDLMLGFGPGDDAFISFGNNLLSGTAVAV